LQLGRTKTAEVQYTTENLIEEI